MPGDAPPQQGKERGLWGRALGDLLRSPPALVGLLLCALVGGAALFGPFLAPHDYRAQEPALMRQQPGAGSWFGRDELGRDIFSRVLHGGRYTVGVGVATVVFGLLVGAPIGLACGYFRGRFDAAVMRVIDVLMAFPDYLVALAIVAVMGFGLLNAALAVGISFIPKFARVVRASALQEASRDYVASARALGAGQPRILFAHVLPNCLAPLLVLGTLSLGSAILFTSALSFLGLGAQPPLPEWGAMLAEGREASLRYPHLMVFPGAAIALAVLGVNLLGDGLRDALDVRLK